ncbi:Separase [Hexamita inflata]|uniref:Separase n=1 Tax=Hexamita inflata TaxID=28002 RepID=A0AA86PNF7_9EUKA|nr:Separase [Hexamita inflata]
MNDVEQLAYDMIEQQIEANYFQQETTLQLLQSIPNNSQLISKYALFTEIPKVNKNQYISPMSIYLEQNITNIMIKVELIEKIIAKQQTSKKFCKIGQFLVKLVNIFLLINQGYLKKLNQTNNQITGLSISVSHNSMVSTQISLLANNNLRQIFEIYRNLLTTLAQKSFTSQLQETTFKMMNIYIQSTQFDEELSNEIQKIQNLAQQVIIEFKSTVLKDDIFDLIYIMLSQVSSLAKDTDSLQSFLKGIAKIDLGSKSIKQLQYLHLMGIQLTRCLNSGQIYETAAKLSFIQQYIDENPELKSSYQFKQIKLVELIFRSELAQGSQVQAAAHIHKFVNQQSLEEVANLLDMLISDQDSRIEVLALIFCAQQMLRSVKNSLYSNFLGENHEVFNVVIRTLKNRGFQTSILSVLLCIQQAVVLIQEFKQHGQFYTNFKLIEMCASKSDAKIPQNLQIDKQLRQIVSFVLSKQDSSSIYTNDVLVHQILNLPPNRFLISKLPIYLQFEHIPKFIDGELINYQTQNNFFYFISNDSVYLQINKQLLIQIQLQINIQYLTDRFQELLSNIEQINSLIKNNTNTQFNQVHQLMLETNTKMIKFAQTELLLTCGVYIGLVTQNQFELQFGQMNELKHWLKFVCEMYQLDLSEENVQVAEILIKGAAISCTVLSTHLSNQELQYAVFAYFAFLVKRTDKQDIMARANAILLHKLADQGNRIMDLNTDKSLDGLIHFVFNCQLVQKDNPVTHLHFDPKIQRFPFELTFKNCSRYQKYDQVEERMQKQYFIDPGLKNTRNTLQKPLENWTEQCQLENAEIFFFGGHGGGEKILKKQKQAPSMLLMGCSSLCEVLVGGNLKYQLRQRFKNSKVSIGCLWDVLSGDLDKLSQTILDGINQGQNVLQVVQQARNISCQYKGLVGASICLYQGEQ